MEKYKWKAGFSTAQKIAKDKYYQIGLAEDKYDFENYILFQKPYEFAEDENPEKIPLEKRLVFLLEECEIKLLMHHYYFSIINDYFCKIFLIKKLKHNEKGIERFTCWHHDDAFCNCC